ncbi:hypothetical protein H113_08275 [Trichophyton rubrum MR1459]|uniref:Multidrug resistance protein n=2 Tax=Trichophyton rubrum TaxID=5551 RepID=A0A178ETB6_TRIRU|nr:uncharacterized protein TERG_11626 [Trichophyton rubrum CBS 118892]EZF90630.1 hypothetical protein H113_08275 [Trichophyton rubrum MR1459]EZG01680.1 hypothetical protein H106_08082 [Trichophyton rubrum CBS 735.88]KMQ46189.1 ABC transporter type 1, transmembrane domain [Trichophyton rubrum]KFL60377.1 hypothetical protein TERG_11626 [Trichophyton rubrum CBS 118892]OAL63199.1 multidrug resistance protein [Trichophyton rubrum]
MPDNEIDQEAKPSGFKSYRRIFRYADRKAWFLYSISFLAATVSILGIFYGWKLGLVCVLAALPLLLLSGYFRIHLESKLEEDTSTRFASSAAIATEAVLAIRTVSSLTLENRILQIYQERLDVVAHQSVKTLTFTTFWYALTQSITFLAMALGF